jgi:hypothetical protein
MNEKAFLIARPLLIIGFPPVWAPPQEHRHQRRFRPTRACAAPVDMIGHC